MNFEKFLRTPILQNTSGQLLRLKDEKNISDSEYSEHVSENSFDKNEDNEIDNLDELFKGMGIEPYRFEPTKRNYEQSQEGGSQIQKENMFLINHWANIRVGKIEWCTCKNCRIESREIDCLYCREAGAISDEQYSGYICDVLHI